MAYAATHVVPKSGLPTWPAPDPAQAQGPRLAPGLDVQLLEWQGSWARVACSNGWQAWVDGRLLTTPGAPTTGPPRSTGIVGLAVGPLGLIGGAVVILASFFDWYTVGPFGASAWDVPFVFLITGGDEVKGLKVGLMLLVAAGILAIPFVTRNASATQQLVFASGIASAGIAVLVLVRMLAEDPAPGLGIGFYLGALGAALIVAEGVRLVVQPAR